MLPPRTSFFCPVRQKQECYQLRLRTFFGFFERCPFCVVMEYTFFRWHGKGGTREPTSLSDDGKRPRALLEGETRAGGDPTQQPLPFGNHHHPAAVSRSDAPLRISLEGILAPPHVRHKIHPNRFTHISRAALGDVFFVLVVPLRFRGMSPFSSPSSRRSPPGILFPPDAREAAFFFPCLPPTRHLRDERRGSIFRIHDASRIATSFSHVAPSRKDSFFDPKGFCFLPCFFAASVGRAVFHWSACDPRCGGDDLGG